jgi:flagellar basal body-associated protein FliL
MADEKKNAAEKPAPAAAKKSLLDNKVVLLGGIVVIQALLAIGLTQFLIMPKLHTQTAGVGHAEVAEPAGGEESGGGGGGGHGGGHGKKEAAGGSQLVSLDEVIVTLQSDGGQARFVRTTVNVEVGAELVEHIASRKAELRDVVIMIVSQHTAAELITPEGKKALRAELTHKLAEKVGHGALKGIYFSDLVIQ